MTAEIAILNKSAIALAADSAATVENPQGAKIYNTVNKLFTLSKRHPVGIMVFGNADIMEIPWETIIKIYRQQLGATKYRKLADYAHDFITFLENGTQLFTKNHQDRYFQSSLLGYYSMIRSEIDKEVKQHIKQNHAITKTQVQNVLNKIISQHHDELNKKELLPNISKSHSVRLTRTYRKSINQIIQEVFEKLPINGTLRSKLKTIAGNIFCKDLMHEGASGVVIAGFGDKETFPSLVGYQIEGLLSNKLKYKQRIKSDVTLTSRAKIVPFAQREMVDTFMQGVHPNYYESLDGYLTLLFGKYPEIIVDSMPQQTQSTKNALKASLKKASLQILAEFKTQMQDYARETHIDPVIRAVSVLPKDELAAMAESLVNLTSFKRRVSLDSETVGGPIDVAVISKGDGFVWIKRKHYFKPELNPAFFANYYQPNSIPKDKS